MQLVVPGGMGGLLSIDHGNVTGECGRFAAGVPGHGNVTVFDEVPGVMRPGGMSELPSIDHGNVTDERGHLAAQRPRAW